MWQIGYRQLWFDSQGDVTRRFAQRALQLATLCALLITFRAAFLRLLGCAGHVSKPALERLPVKRPRTAQEPPSWFGGHSGGDNAAVSGSTEAAAQPLLIHDLHARTWPTASTPSLYRSQWSTAAVPHCGTLWGARWLWMKWAFHSPDANTCAFGPLAPHVPFKASGSSGD